MDAEHNHYHEEAQVVAFTSVSFSGFELNITARQGATAEVILDTTRELVKALRELKKAGAEPVVKTWHSNGNGSQKPAAAADHDFDALPGHQASAYQPARSNGNGQTSPAPAAQPAAPVLDNGAPDPAWCAIHQCAMNRHEKAGVTWFSHRIGETWCKGKPAKA